MSNFVKLLLGRATMAAAAVWLACIALPSGNAAAELAVRLPDLPFLAMREPKYSGFTQDGRNYEFTAGSAVLDSDNRRVFVDEPHASLELSDGTKVTIDGATGVFDPKGRALTISSAVLTSASGTTIRMGEALINMRENSVISNQPVRVKLDDRTIRGSRLELRKQSITIYDGLVINPDGVIRFQAYGVL